MIEQPTGIELTQQELDWMQRLDASVTDVSDQMEAGAASIKGLGLLLNRTRALLWHLEKRSAPKTNEETEP